MTRMADEPGIVPAWTVGDRMTKALSVSGISVGEMADYLEVSRQTIGRWINDHGPVKRSTITLWALATGVDRAWLETGMAPTAVDGEGQQYTSTDSNREPADSSSGRAP